VGFLIPFWVEVIGVFAGFLGVIAWVPQIKRVWSEKKHDGISLPTFTLVSISLILWLVYGIIIGSVAMTLANIAALSCIIAIIVGVVKLRN
jgi:MtN3 and saliva related transmembrane protein|tara:strand:+ start:67 stop:339 length:273 start_codon:yes stop_codon:yes gene_type:complete